MSGSIKSIDYITIASGEVYVGGTETGSGSNALTWSSSKLITSLNPTVSWPEPDGVPPVGSSPSVIEQRWELIFGSYCGGYYEILIGDSDQTMFGFSLTMPGGKYPPADDYTSPVMKVVGMVPAIPIATIVGGEGVTITYPPAVVITYGGTPCQYTNPPFSLTKRPVRDYLYITAGRQSGGDLWLEGQGPPVPSVVQVIRVTKNGVQIEGTGRPAQGLWHNWRTILSGGVFAQKQLREEILSGVVGSGRFYLLQASYEFVASYTAPGGNPARLTATTSYGS